MLTNGGGRGKSGWDEDPGPGSWIRQIEYFSWDINALCGVAGYLDRSNSADPTMMEQLVRRMSQAIRHRGPDANGVWVDAMRGVALGFRRLAIIDLSETGNQPMLSHSGRYTIVFNGEVYNFREMRAELEAEGASFRGTSDTEVLLTAIEHWGIEPAIQRANGMLAFALWDRETGSLTLARDRTGKKPLYYGWSNGVLLFASELKAIRQHPAFSGSLNRDAIAQLVRFGWIPAPHSIYREIRKLPPGTYLTVRPETEPDGATPRPYWQAKQHVEQSATTPFAGGYDRAVQTLDELLRSSVGQRMIADVDLGALLSGGIDSTIVVAIMQSLADRPVRTFTIGFHDKRYDEAAHAKRIAAHLGTDHTELYVSPDDGLDVIARLPSMFDEPFADSSQIPTFLVSQLAVRSVKVALSGDGGDELFAGYKRYQECLSAWHSWGELPTAIRQAGAGALTALSAASWRLSGSLPNAQADMPSWRRFGSTWKKTAHHLIAESPRDLLARMLAHAETPDSIVPGAQPLRTVLNDPDSWAAVDDPLLGLMHMDFIGYLPDDILVKVDRASMAVSLEARAPLLDYRIAEFAWSLPVDMRVDKAGGKRILKSVLARYVPAELSERPKQGFSVPVADWLRGPLRPWAEDLLSPARLQRDAVFDAPMVRRLWDQHQSGWRKHTKALWGILMFQAWLDTASTPISDSGSPIAPSAFSPAAHTRA